MGIFDNDTAEEKLIRALKFVNVALKDGHLTDISIAMILVELKREGVTLTNGER